MRELENFALDSASSRGGLAIGGRLGASNVRTRSSLAPSRSRDTRLSSSSSESSSESSTASYEDRPPYSTTRSRSNLTPRHHHHHHRDDQQRRRDSNRVPPTPPADLVAHPLPGYGPPRTRQDSVRVIPEDRFRDEVGGSNNRRRRREAEEVGAGGRRREEEEEDSEDYSSDEDDSATGPYASIPATAPPSIALRSAPPPLAHVNEYDSLSHPSSRQLPPSHLQQPLSSSNRPPYPSDSIRADNSPAPSIYSLNHNRQPPSGSHHQIAVAYPPNHQVATTSSTMTPIAPLTSSNLLQQRSATTIPVQQSQSTIPDISAIDQRGGGGGEKTTTGGLDQALDRIQTSLTALHERLSILEHSPNSNSNHSSSRLRSGQGGEYQVSTLLKQILNRFLTVMKIRQSTSTTTTNSHNRPKLSSLVLRLLIALMSTMRRIAGDLIVTFVVVTVLARWRGIDLKEVVGNWVVRYVVTGAKKGIKAAGGGRLKDT